jgi:hypothetical protein
MYVCMAEIEPAPEPAPEYVYVEPYHHANTTKHGASNWSWTKLWQAVHGQLPIPLCYEQHAHRIQGRRWLTTRVLLGGFQSDGVGSTSDSPEIS